MFQEENQQNQETDQSQQQEQAPEQKTSGEQESGTPNAEGQFEEMLQGITNETGKPKYSSVQQALGSIPHAQKHINQLETDNQTLKDEIQSLKDQVQEYKTQVERYGSLEDLLENKQETKGLSQEELDQYLENKLAERENAQTAKQNQTQVVNSLVELFGDKDKAAQEFNTLQQELGVNLEQLAAQSPKAVLRYFKKPESKAPDKFDGQSRQEFKPSETPTKARMPRTTKESVQAWREVGQSVRSKYGIE